MAREPVIAVCVVALGLIAASGVTAQAAAMDLAGTPSPAPTSEATRPTSTEPPARLGTVTPVVGTQPPVRATPTLMPPPGSGGRVAVEALYVRDQPSFSGNVVGVIPYGQSVYPVGRNGDSSWIAVNWASARGWVYAEMIAWDPALDLNSLPTLVQSTGVPPTPSGSPVPSATEPPAASPSSQPPSDTPTAAATPDTPTREAIVAPTLGGPTPRPFATAPVISAPSGGIPASAQTPLFAGLSILVIGGLAYFWQWSAGRNEVRRYARGFVLTICPVCQEGHIHLDEVVRSTAGVQWVRRTARCDTCNSVLRELRPGLWRYSVDAYVNPELAERFKSQRATTAELQDLARHIILKQPDPELDEPTVESLNLSWLEIDEPLGSEPEGDTSTKPKSEDGQPEEKAS